MNIAELYQELIMEHCKEPRNCSVLLNATHQAEGFNPLCGDRVKVYLKVKKGAVEEISFQGEGCAISKASASMMTEELKGMSLEEAKALSDSFRAAVTGANLSQPSLTNLEPLLGVKNFPTRVKCATLAWHAFEDAIKATKR
jgi:nitrogen fixation NifU-like protein